MASLNPAWYIHGVRRRMKGEEQEKGGGGRGGEERGGEGGMEEGRALIHKSWQMETSSTKGSMHIELCGPPSAMLHMHPKSR